MSAMVAGRVVEFRRLTTAPEYMTSYEVLDQLGRSLGHVSHDRHDATPRRWRAFVPSGAYAGGFRTRDLAVRELVL